MVDSRQKPGKNDRGLAGSPLAGEPEFLAVGRLRRTHGLKGEIIMDVLTDFPERLKAGKMVLVGEDHVEMMIRSLRPKDKQVLIAFEDAADLESARNFSNQYVFVRTTELPPLEDGEYYHHQLLGMKVYGKEEHFLGILDEILETGANDVYVIIHPESGEEILFPAVDEFILEIDIKQNRMVISPPEWQ